MARSIMLQGTGSDVGKTVLVAGLCRLATNLGLKVRPFKPQNMSNNAAVAADGGYLVDPQTADTIRSMLVSTASVRAIAQVVQVEAASPLHQIVYREPGRFGGWPANHGIWSWGDEVVVGFTAAWHKAQDADRHQMDRVKPREQYQARTLDGGRTWSTVSGGPALWLLAWTDGAVYGVGEDGVVHASQDDGRTWSARTTLPAAAMALAA